jgi:LacI family gluconate utilization system Gnt-I transcriptional repressor
LDGFTKAVTDGGGTLTRQFCLHDTANFYPGYYGTEQLLATGAHVECVFYQNDSMAFGGFQYCERIGLSVPEDIGIAGWGDMPISSVLSKRLTSIHVPHLKLGQAAAQAMVARLKGEPVEDSLNIGFLLVPGQTVKKA